jgi:hypothetical protein
MLALGVPISDCRRSREIRGDVDGSPTCRHAIDDDSWGVWVAFGRCEELAGYGLATIQHDDFHDGQVFVTTAATSCRSETPVSHRSSHWP